MENSCDKYCVAQPLEQVQSVFHRGNPIAPGRAAQIVYLCAMPWQADAQGRISMRFIQVLSHFAHGSRRTCETVD